MRVCGVGFGFVVKCVSFPRPEQACNCSTSPIYTHTDTPQRVRGWWGRGVTVHGTGFPPASLESGLFLQGSPRRLHSVTFAPTSQFSPYLHTRDSTQIHHSEYEVGGRGGVHSSWDGVSTCVPGVRVVPSGAPPPTSLCDLLSHSHQRCVVAEVWPLQEVCRDRRPQIGHDTPPEGGHTSATTHLGHHGHNTSATRHTS